MSTAICAAPRRPASRGGIITGPLVVVFTAEFCALTSFYLLLSVTPTYAAAMGAGSAGAGLVTGVLLLGTVAAELAAPVLMTRYGYLTLLAAGLLLLGLPALPLLAGGGLAVILTVSVVRGFGFGLSTVVTGALTATLVPPERRAEGLGLFGVVATAPAIVALPAGVWLAGHVSMAVVIGAAAATAVLPVAALARQRGLPDGHGAAAASPGTERAAGLVTSLRRAGQLRPFLLFATSAVAAGVVVSFLPLASRVSADVATAGLLLQALTATVSRWWAGRAGDRHGNAGLLVPALALSALGMITMIWLASPIAVIVGMCLFGTGFGISQNATFTLMVDRMPTSGLGVASALWNLAYDAGYGAGPAAFGLVVGHTGYPAAFAVVGAVLLAALPSARREQSGASPGPATPQAAPPRHGTRP